MNKALLTFVLLAALCFAAIDAKTKRAPPTPIWPSAFSATVSITSAFQPFPIFFRWFYSQSADYSRGDGVDEFFGEFYVVTRYFDHTNQVQYNVYYREDTVTCVKTPLTHSLPDPDFSQFSYRGTALINYQTADVWESSPAGANYVYYEANNKPIRFDATNTTTATTVSFNFWEFDIGTQDSNLFVIQPDVAAICFSPPQ
eukprot:TRINITY_DN1120_c0_g1_i1.p1 TRINITY_DN1120_c0_g1~~TRINITY_DN1120_c0_g1_i1.p1  ORF type:complete len:200 (-),score=51.33 TRINITY_DN1120_c0_g1_i1:90-689(-)